MMQKSVILAIVMALALAATAQQTSSPPASSKPAPAKAAATAAATPGTLVGCLAGPNADGFYELKNPAYRKTVLVRASDEIKAHAGHQVKLRGQWDKQSATSPKLQGEWKVEKVEMISETCPTAKAAPR